MNNRATENEKDLMIFLGVIVLFVVFVALTFTGVITPIN